MIAALLIGFVGIPVGHKQLLKWRQQRAEGRRTAEMIPVFFTDAQSVAAVLRDVYADRIHSGNALKPQQPVADRVSIGVDTRTNCVVAPGPESVVQEMQDLVSALDGPHPVSKQVTGSTMPNSSREMIEEALLDALESASP